MFSQACVKNSVHSGGLHGRGSVRGRKDGHCSGWFASYWNAFSFAKYVHAIVGILRSEEFHFGDSFGDICSVFTGLQFLVMAEQHVTVDDGSKFPLLIGKYQVNKYYVTEFLWVCHILLGHIVHVLHCL